MRGVLTILLGAALCVAARAEERTYNPADLWAFQPLRRSAGGSIDFFITARLKEKRLPAAPRADVRTLIRRATFDLTGLPPTPAEVDAFVRDRSPDAFHKVVERLLASPRYGERWGRHWLDVVRYADSDGYSNDYERPNAWRYRDYVIRAFNEDKPYDQFVSEQIAGDELDGSKPQNLIATGFLRMGPWEQTAMSVAAVTRQAFLDDVTHSTGTAFLGLTMGCARCHDHKFDPIPTRDYYRLQAVFAATQFDQQPAEFLAAENRADFDGDKARLEELVRRNEAHLERMRNVVRERLLKKQRVKSLDEIAKEEVQKSLRTFDQLNQSDFELVKVYRKRLELLRRELDRYKPFAFTVKNAEQPAATFVLGGGSLAAPKEEVTPGVVTVTYRYHERARAEVPAEPRGRRLALARWIASPENPLTARVMVNRIWAWHFGRGLAANPNNFGKMGKRPTHPELLDWMAAEFIRSGWSVKHMHRLIMRSAAYQRASQHRQIESVRKVDPENQLLSYFSPRRLEAEEIRDTILAVSGELSLAAGGPGAFPEINDDVAAQPRLIMGTVAPLYLPSPLKRQRNRRTIYTHQKRGLPDPLIETFNGASVNESCERREASTVPAQAFTLLNSRFSRDMALAFAARIARETEATSAQVDCAFRLAFTRLPSAGERAKALAFLAQMKAYHRAHRPPSRTPRKQVVRTMVTEQTGQPLEVTEETEPAKFEENLHPSEVSPDVRALADLALALINSNEFMYVY